MIQSDYHVHTSFSADSDTPAQQQAEAAAAAGIRWLCITDHMDPGYPGGEFCLDLDRYCPAISALASRCQERLTVRTGIELGLWGAMRREIEEAASHYPWDFIIGSSHVVDGADPYYPEYWTDKTVRQAVTRYYEATLDNIRTFGCFDVYGHIDYIIRYIPAERRSEYNSRDYDDIIDEILRQLILRGKGIECNTAGFKYGLGHPNPTERILRHYFELGGEILTIGSDGHKPKHVAYDFKKLPALLLSCGARYYTVFEGRRPFMLPID